MNYSSLIASQTGIGITNTTIQKNCGRYTSENSLISAMALFFVIALTHFVPVLKLDSHVYHELKDAPDGVRFLFDLVSKLHNNAPIEIEYPELLLSTDDTLQYIFGGKGETNEAFVLVLSKYQK